MSGAMLKDKKTGLVKYNEEKCVSCYMCIMSCPFGVLKCDNKEKIVKCDFCEDRETLRCVDSSPVGALYI